MSASTAAQSGNNNVLTLCPLVLVKMDEFNDEFCIFIIFGFISWLFYFENSISDVNYKKKKEMRKRVSENQG